MTFFVLLLVLAAVLVAATIRAAVRDDRGSLAPPASRFRDPRFLPPSARS